MKTTILLLTLIIGLTGYAQRPSALNNGKFITANNTALLYGGSEEEHFKIDNLDLKREQFHYGLGRERFPALLKPNFETVAKADKNWKNEDRFLVAKKGNTVKAYSVQDLTRHEVVNDDLEGEPIFAAYCVLADLGAVYKRTYNDKVFTFGVSGYTYFDPNVWNGLDGFILWDRETESLWWPLIDKAVSGQLKGVPLLKLEDAHWEDTTWAAIKTKYPNAQVLSTGQDFDRPKTWKRYNNVDDVVEKYTPKNK